MTVLALILGAVFGWRRAAQRGGNRLDKLQYAAAHGLAFMLLTLFIVTIARHWIG